MTWVLILEPAVNKFLKRIPHRDAERIIARIEMLRIDPIQGDVVRIHGETGTWRLRIGSYRVFFELDKVRKTVFVDEIRRRTTNTYR